MNATDEYERQFARISSANPVKKSSEQIAVNEYKAKLKKKINKYIKKKIKDQSFIIRDYYETTSRERLVKEIGEEILKLI